MDQERNPNKNAELSMEQNYNQIDGIINNLPVPPPEDKPLDKVCYFDEIDGWYDSND